jgi:lincosamide nucleotidyltransferase A/C/D/E
VRTGDATEILDRLEAARIWYCVEGGWGVDALLGERTRAHDDLDLAVSTDDVARICETLREFERSDVEWPASFVLRDARGRKVDAHPLTFDANGDGWQQKQDGGAYRWPGEHLDARGRIDGREVRCITPELQLRWHDYDGFDDVDWIDMQALTRRFGLTLEPARAQRPGFVAAKRRG